MSQLEDQLAELLRKKETVDIYKSLAKEIEKSPSFSNVDVSLVEVILGEIAVFISGRVTEIETGQKSQSAGDVLVDFFTPEEVDILKEVAARTLQRMEAPPQQINKPRRAPVASGAFADDDEMEAPPLRQNRPVQRTPPKKAVNQDIVAFAMAHRHLDGKRCTVATRNGDVGGKIVGTEAPNLIIQMDTGHTIKAEPENVTVG